MPVLDSRARERLPDSSFAYIDSTGKRRLPIHDASHVRNALARFDQVRFEDDAARDNGCSGSLKNGQRMRRRYIGSAARDI